jgi:hypothetical protein
MTMNIAVAIGMVAGEQVGRWRATQRGLTPEQALPSRCTALAANALEGRLIERALADAALAWIVQANGAVQRDTGEWERLERLAWEDVRDVVGLFDSGERRSDVATKRRREFRRRD